MKTRLVELTVQDPDTALVHAELKGRLGRLGAAHVGSVFGANPKASTVDRLWTLNNVLRQFEEGHGDRQVLG